MAACLKLKLYSHSANSKSQQRIPIENSVFRLVIIAQSSSSSSSSSSFSNGKRNKKPFLEAGLSKPSITEKEILALTKEKETAFADFLKLKEDELSDDGISQIVDAATDLKKKVKLMIKRGGFWKKIGSPSRKIFGIVVLNILTVIYASNIPVIKEVEAVVDPSLFSVARFTVATVPFIPFMFQTRRDVGIQMAGLELGLWVSGGYLLQGIGLLTSDAGRSSFIAALTVIVVPLLDGLFGARIPKITWFGATVALLGIALLESSGSPITIGDFWNLLSAIFFGIHMLRTEHFSRNTRTDKYLGLLGYEISVIAFVSAIWYWWANDMLSFNFMHLEDVNWMDSLQNLVTLPWLPIIYTGFFSTGFCLWAELAAMRDVSATDTAIIYGLEPLWGAAFAWILLGERWGPTGWLGAVLILGGSFTVQLFGSSPMKPSTLSSKSPSELKDRDIE
ncbi:uncharacterized protein LOC131028868 isoform X1 [Cryptomeria japonica]|uniref:uncharacterized protein LOC131028868 isoform X1 n=2 Tax=Cryptomeria japonica TaxID=3369 RepID=UPI0025ABE345|nr:uncharacterized protein LOC131028868 isoform X1 [Cryptomeria japonica]